MNVSHQFGGDWTEEKLERIRKYLEAYMQIFTRNKRASFYTTYYVDAFAGTGYRDVETERGETAKTFFEYDTDVRTLESDAASLQKGSARVALEITSPFKNYVFIEKKTEFVESLHRLKQDFPSRNISIFQEEANKALQDWINKIDWNSSRAVVFLDPYGMQVNWETIKVIAETKAIDLWILFPLAQAVNRLLTTNKLPNDGWSRTLTRFFGTVDWQDAFYKQTSQQGLFGNELPQYRKEADFSSISQFFVKRLESVFAKVAPNPLPLFNSKGSPLFLLCFAASNPKGADTAVKIAQNILSRPKS